MNGHKDTAEWLYTTSKRKGNKKINIYNYKNFIDTLANGYVHIVNWLYKLSKIDNNKTFDKTFFNYDAFSDIYMRSGKSAKLAMEWLYLTSFTSGNEPINIRQDNDSLFKLCCNYRRKEEAEWLLTLCSDYSIDNRCNQMVPVILSIQLKIKDYLLSNDKIHELYQDATTEIKEDDPCMICLSEEETHWIKLDCNHSMCINCYTLLDNCPYKCKNGHMTSVRYLLVESQC